MLNREKHQLIMIKILKDIYSDIEISSFLGFKGGTAAYLFYNLSRFSVDLDFDLVNCSDNLENEKQLIFSRLEKILGRYGVIKEKRIKRWTIFLLLSYGGTDHNIKIEISTRQHKNKYEVKEYLGIAVLVAEKETLFANKLVALNNRTNIAMRDVYDIYFFMKNNWDIDREVISFWTDKSLGDYLKVCIDRVKEINNNMILHGLGEVLEDEDKAWVKSNLKEETIFLLKNYKESLK